MSLKEITEKTNSIADNGRRLQELLRLYRAGQVYVFESMMIEFTATFKNQLKNLAKTVCDELIAEASELKELIP